MNAARARAACAAVVVLAAAAGCGPAKRQGEAPARARSSATAEEVEPENVGRFDVELVDARVPEVLAVVEQATKRSVAVDAGALHAASCATVSLHLRRADASILADRVAVALRPKGFLFQSRANGFVVTLDPNVTPPRCPGDPAPAAPTRADEDANVDLTAVRDEIRHGQGTVKPNERTITRRARDLLRRYAARIFEDVSLVPETSDGGIVGLRIVTSHGEPILHGLGLRAGDVVEAIDGKSLTDANAALEAYKAMRESDRVSIAVLRNGRVEHVVIRTVD